MEAPVPKVATAKAVTKPLGEAPGTQAAAAAKLAPGAKEKVRAAPGPLRQASVSATPVAVQPNTPLVNAAIAKVSTSPLAEASVTEAAAAAKPVKLPKGNTAIKDPSAATRSALKKADQELGRSPKGSMSVEGPVAKKAALKKDAHENSDHGSSRETSIAPMAAAPKVEPKKAGNAGAKNAALPLHAASPKSAPEEAVPSKATPGKIAEARAAPTPMRQASEAPPPVEVQPITPLAHAAIAKAVPTPLVEESVTEAAAALSAAVAAAAAKLAHVAKERAPAADVREELRAVRTLIKGIAEVKKAAERGSN